MLGIFRSNKPKTSKPMNATDAFDGCPNREIRPKSGSNGLEISCPKYTDPVPLGYTALDGLDTRQSIALKLGCFGCSYNRVDFGEQSRSDRMDSLHPAVSENAGPLFATEHYPEAAMKGFQTVRDRLRELTGFEKATEAFGKGRLRIEGASAEHVDDDFQRAAQFLMMAVDMFRNEGAHSNFGSATGSQRSYEYLTISSLAMNLLDNGTVPEDPSQPLG